MDHIYLTQESFSAGLSRGNSTVRITSHVEKAQDGLCKVYWYTRNLKTEEAGFPKVRATYNVKTADVGFRNVQETDNIKQQEKDSARKDLHVM